MDNQNKIIAIDSAITSQQQLLDALITARDILINGFVSDSKEVTDLTQKLAAAQLTPPIEAPTAEGELPPND